MEDFERNFENDEEQAAAARSSPSSGLLLYYSPGTSGNPALFFNSLHRSRVRRSSDGKEEDSFLEEDSPMDVDWRSDSQERCLTQQPTSLGVSNEMTSSNITRLRQSLVEAVEAAGNLSLQCSYLPQQECGRHLSTQASFSKKGVNLELPVEGFLGMSLWILKLVCFKSNIASLAYRLCLPMRVNESRSTSPTCVDFTVAEKVSIWTNCSQNNAHGQLHSKLCSKCWMFFWKLRATIEKISLCTVQNQVNYFVIAFCENFR